MSDTRSILFIAIAGIAIIAGIGAISYFGGGLPGTKNSPTATVHGTATTGKTAAD